MESKIESSQNYQRKVSPLEGMFFHAPYAIVSMVARIKGNITKDLLRGAVIKVQQRHGNLRSRIEMDENGIAWFTSQDVKEIPIDFLGRESKDQWLEVVNQYSQIPFEFEQRPAVRLILVHSPLVSELVILCHHTICDGLSLAYLARDLMDHLGDPAREVEILPDPVPIDKDNLPVGISMNSVVNFFVKRINNKWLEDKITFDQADYEALSETYWSNFDHKKILIELSEIQTTELVDRCKAEGTTVNSALSVALAAAQRTVEGVRPHHSKITVAGSLRDRLKEKVGEGMGFFAGAVNLDFKFNDKIGFWENTRKFNSKIQPLYTNKNLFGNPLVWCYMESGILESLSFKMIGNMVSHDSNRYEKLSSFSAREDVITSMLKREKMDSMDNILIGTAVTNLTRLDFPRNYGELELERLIMSAGGAYPLVFVNLLAGVVTCSGKLSLVIEYSEERIATDTVEEIKEKVLEYLLE